MCHIRKRMLFMLYLCIYVHMSIHVRVSVCGESLIFNVFFPLSVEEKTNSIKK